MASGAEASDEAEGAEVKETGNPIFVLMMPDRDVLIYANGVVEGAPEGTKILNSIPIAIYPEWRKFFSKDPFAEAKKQKAEK